MVFFCNVATFVLHDVWFTKGSILLFKLQLYKYFILIQDTARSILSSISYWYEHICSWSLPVSVFHKGLKEHTILPHCPWKWIGLPICDYFMIDNAFFKTIYNDTKGPTGISFIDDAIHCDITILIHFTPLFVKKKGREHGIQWI